MKPKSTHKQAAAHNRDTKQTTKHKKKKDPKPNPKISPAPPKQPTYFEATGTGGRRGRRLRLAGVSICNRTAAGQPDVESLCPLRAPFRPNDDGRSSRWSMWVSKREIRLSSGIRSGKNGVDAVETMTKGVKMVDKTIRRTSVSSGTTSEKPIYIPR
jgi:hypothetical protein